MKLSKQQLSDIIYVPVIKDDLDRLASEARAALEDGTLEIDGYSRNEWTKFDPSDRKTFPACDSGWFLIAAQKSIEPPTFTMMTELATEELLEEIRNDIVKFNLNVYWRPLPPPPGKDISNETK